MESLDGDSNIQLVAAEPPLVVQQEDNDCLDCSNKIDCSTDCLDSIHCIYRCHVNKDWLFVTSDCEAYKSMMLQLVLATVTDGFDCSILFIRLLLFEYLSGNMTICSFFLHFKESNSVAIFYMSTKFDRF